jgi:hypothetical protein
MTLSLYIIDIRTKGHIEFGPSRALFHLAVYGNQLTKITVSPVNPKLGKIREQMRTPEQTRDLVGTNTKKVSKSGKYVFYPFVAQS